jgi:hypothetical protein
MSHGDLVFIREVTYYTKSGEAIRLRELKQEVEQSTMLDGRNEIAIGDCSRYVTGDGTIYETDKLAQDGSIECDRDGHRLWPVKPD